MDQANHVLNIKLYLEQTRQRGMEYWETDELISLMFTE